MAFISDVGLHQRSFRANSKPLFLEELRLVLWTKPKFNTSFHTQNLQTALDLEKTIRQSVKSFLATPHNYLGYFKTTGHAL